MKSLSDFFKTYASWNEEGRALIKKGKYEEAIVCFDAALELNDKNKEAWHNRSDALEKLEKYEQAIICCDAILKRDVKDTQTLKTKAHLFEKLGKYVEAIGCYEQILKLDAKNEEAWNNKGEALRNLSKNEEAIDCYNQALKLNYDVRKTLFLKNKGAFDNVTSAMQATILTLRYKTALTNKATVLNNIGKYQEAIACWDEALQFDVKDTPAWYNKGIVLKKLGKYQEAIACFDQATKMDPKHKDAWYGQGSALHHLGKYKEAMICYDRVINLDVKHKEAWHNKSDVLSKLGDYAGALTCCEQALKLDNDFKAALRNKGNILLNLGKCEEALVCHDRVINLDSTFKGVWNDKGVVLARLGRYQEAIVCYDQALKLDAKNKAALDNKARALSDLGKYEEAIVYHDTAINLDLQYKAAWNSKGRTLFKMGNYEDAIKCYDYSIKLDNKDKNAWIGKGYVLLCTQRFPEAEVCFDKVLTTNNRSSESLQGKGLLAYAKNDYSKADEFFKNAEQNALEQYYLHYCRGKVFVHLKMLDVASVSFRKAVFIQPNFIPAQLELTKLDLDPSAVKEIIHHEKKISTADYKFFGTIEISFSISPKQLTLEQELGRGGFGIVYKGTYRHSEVAIKQLQAVQLSDKALKEFQSEMQIMARLRSPNIVQLYGITNEKPYCIVMEYMPKGDLYNLLHSKEELSWEQRAQIALDIARGIAFLHAENIMHRDLKSKNILLDEILKAKIADLGLAIITKENSISSTEKIVGTLAWMAPEVIRGEKYTLKADIFSYGVLLWELSARETPFAKAHGNQTLIATWKSMGERDEIPKVTPQKLGKLIEASWAQKPEDRPSAEQAVQQLQTENTVTSSVPKSNEYRSNLDSDSMDSGYRNNLESDNDFRP